MFKRNLRGALMGDGGSEGVCSAGEEGGEDTVSGGGGNQTPWYDGVDGETLGVLQTKGWDKLDAKQAVSQAIGSYREAEKFLGVPKDQLLRKPDVNDPVSQRAFWKNFGTPDDKTGYDFSQVKHTNGDALDENFTAAMRDIADSLNLPKDAAAAVAAGIIKFQEGSTATAAGEVAAVVKTQQDALKANWGGNYDAHKFMANQGALKVGVTQDEFNKLFETPGGAKMLDIFHKIGGLTGEGRFISGGANEPGNLTREQALAQKNDLMNDSAWVTKYNNGDAAAVKRMTGLNTVIVADMREEDFF